MDKILCNIIVLFWLIQNRKKAELKKSRGFFFSRTKNRPFCWFSSVIFFPAQKLRALLSFTTGQFTIYILSFSNTPFFLKLDGSNFYECDCRELYVHIT